MAQFEFLGVIPEIIRATEDMEWTLPTTVQDDAIPLILGGGDVMIAAETGSGKTGAFSIPVLQIIYETLKGIAGTEQKADCAENPVASAIQWDSRDRDQAFAISPDGYSCQTRVDGAWFGARANVGLVKGKHFFEGTCKDEGLSRVGFSTANATFNIGTDAFSFGFGGTAKKSHSSKFEDYGQRFVKGDTIGCYLDLDSFTISYSKNGQQLGKAFDIPATLHNTPFYPSVVLKNAEMDFNFGSSPFKFPPAAPFKPIREATETEVYHEPKQSAKASQRVKTDGKGPFALIIEPTQELAAQVDNEISKLKIYLENPRITNLLVAGQSNVGETKRLLSAGVHIVTCTIGMVTAMIKSRQIDLNSVLYLILDEADQLLDQGNKSAIMDIFKKLPTEDSRFQCVVCSATLHTPGIAELANSICKRPQWVDLKGKDSVPDLVDHAFISVNPATDTSWKSMRDYQDDYVHHNHKTSGESKDATSFGIKMLKPMILLEVIDAFKMDQCMIFCRTRVDCENLANFLNKRGGGQIFRGKVESGKENKYSCAVLHGGKGPQRAEALEAFKDGDVRFLICTDVAARGIDVKELPFVVNMTLPEPSEQYIHRVGRVGRAGCPGLAISLCATAPEKVWWHTCNRKDRGVGCRNNALLEAQGCCKWFDEPAIKKEIEVRLSKGKETPIVIPYMERSNLTLGREHCQAMAKQHRGGDTSSRLLAQSQEHVDILRPAVTQLADLEVLAQRNYLHLTHSGVFHPTGTTKKTKA